MPSPGSREMQQSTKQVSPSHSSQKRKLNVVVSKKRLNEKLVGLLEELAAIEKARGEPFKSRAYKKAAETVMEARADITNVAELEGKPGIGKKIFAKFKQFEAEGDVDLLRRERDNPVVKLNEVHGIGPKKAQDLVKKYDIKTVADLKRHASMYVTKEGKLVSAADRPKGSKPLLDATQRLGVRYFDDLQERIPRSEIDQFSIALRAALSKLDFPGQQMEIVGSYRREKQNSGDIDVILTDAAGNKNLLADFAQELEKEKLIEAFLTRGASKIMAVARLPGGKARRMDLMFAPPKEYPFAVLYFTGSAAFNIGTRLRALELGLSLSEHGFKDSKTGDAVDMNVNNEKDIFKILKIAYKAPSARVNSESVVRSVDSSGPVEAVAADASSKSATTNTASTIKPKRKRKLLISDAPAAPDSIQAVVLSTSPKELTKPQTPSKSKKSRKLQIVSPPKKTTLRKKMKMTATDNINAYKAQGVRFLGGLTQKELEAMIKASNDVYRNAAEGAQLLLTDPQYDILVENLKERFPSSAAADAIGAPVERAKVKLPYTMFSMDKIKPDTGALDKWLAKMQKKSSKGKDSTYVVSAKLDGVSGLYVTEGKPALYTRGDGYEGQDVSNMIKHLRLPDIKDVVVRGEFIFPKSVFEEKYAKKYANARNLVSGVVNAKKGADLGKYKDLDFVAYEVVKPVMLPSEQMAFLQEKGFHTVVHRTEHRIDNELLSHLLQDWRHSYAYEIDGVIVTDDNPHPRKDQNPEYSFAFKMVLSDQLAETVVHEVIWTPSEYGYLKPKLLVKPVRIGGALIKYVTANNARYIVDNKIGPGAVVMMERAGDVIPKIAEVVVPAQEPQMPTIPYIWNDTQVDIMLENPKSSDAVRLRNLSSFFAAIKIDGLGPGSAAKLFEAGYDTIPKVVQASEEQIQKAVGKANGAKIWKSIKSVLPTVPMAKLMAASGVFGRGMGSRRIQQALNAYPDLLVMPPDDVEAAVSSVEGFAKKTATQFSENLSAFKEFYAQLGLGTAVQAVAKISKSSSLTSDRLAGIKVVFSGKRYPDLEEAIKANGGDIGNSISKTTTFLVLKDPESTSKKANDARSHGVKIVTVEQLKSTLEL